MTHTDSIPTMAAYQRGQRRMLVDMEVPAWDPRFLTEYDPILMTDLYERAGAESVMFVCKNLSGYCFWPTKVGEMHPRLNGRDVVAETITALNQRGIAACAYYAAIYDNWPFHEHPDWRVEPAAGWERSLNGTARDRHGLCCPNNLDYRRFLADQIADLLGRYEFECAFCDMSFWPTICVCDSCQRRAGDEVGGPIPSTVDWTSPSWCAYHAARDRWIDEFQGFVTAAMKDASPGIAVYHNFATGTAHWLRGVPLSVTRHSDFLGGDLYGDTVEQLFVEKLMNGLSRTRPVEFMTFATTHAFEHTRLKSPSQLRTQVLAATAEETAFMYIEAIDPIGTPAEPHYDLIGDAFAAGRELVSFPPSIPIADVAIYFSGESRVDFTENGRSIEDISMTAGAEYTPHVAAVRNAVRMLQRAHLPFAIATRLDLTALDRFPVLVLPNVVRLDAEEVSAFRKYVADGGRLYATRYTSLLDTSGVLHPNFQLADLFGADLRQEEPAGLVYARPATADAQRWFHPQRYMTSDQRPGALRGGLLRVTARLDAHPLATLTLPFAHPESGDVFHDNWASIHTSPPWEDTDEPVVLEHPYQAGRVIYSTLDIGGDGSEAGERIFAALIRRLVAERWSVTCDTAPAVTVSAFRSAEPGMVKVTLLNSPRLAIERTTVNVRLQPGARVVDITRSGTGDIDWAQANDGAVAITVDQLGELEVLIVRSEVS